MYEQVQSLYRSPTYRRSLAARLEAEREAKNNGTIPGGLASMIDAGTAAYLNIKDQGDQAKASDALSRGMVEETQVNTADGMQPNAPRIAPGLEGARERLGALKGNEYAGRLSQMLAFQDLEAKQRAAELADQRGWQTQQMEAGQNFQRDMQGRQQAFQRSMQRAPERRIVTGVDGRSYFLDTGEPALPNEGAAPRKPPKVIDFKMPDGSTVLAEFNEDTGKWDPVDIPEGATPGAVKGQKPFTDAQSKNVIYATRAKGALETLDKYGDALTSIGDKALEMDPTGLARGFQSEDFQLAQTSGQEFLQAILRKDTGAAITKDEQTLYGGTYLPQPGDGPRVKAYKKGARQRAIDALNAGMSPEEMLAQERAFTKDRTPIGEGGDIGNGIKSLDDPLGIR